jgi:hypothetical protein
MIPGTKRADLAALPAIPPEVSMDLIRSQDSSTETPPDVSHRAGVRVLAEYEDVALERLGADG